MSTSPETVVGMVLLALPTDRVPLEADIVDIVDRLAEAFGLSEDGRGEVLQKVLARRLVRMDTGFGVVEHHVPWVDASRPQIDPYYWSRFRLLLLRAWAPAVVDALDRSTEEILDLFGNPREIGTWKRRGLVMGDVQSGKTAAYIALICKAADAGYGFIVLLTGTIETLRRQTQERVDAGFVGFDSSEQLKRNARSLQIGVGTLDGRRQATVFTSTAADFRGATLEALGLSLESLREPAIVVIKKNTRIMTNLRDWLRSYNVGAQSGGIDIPMLLIDDEADNASINTNDPEKDPTTAVNAAMRELLTLFRRTTYVGFTATPFANIFVNPDTKEDMLGDDLFPRDFIYTLQSPTNYFGARRIFRDDDGAAHLRPIQDLETVLPAQHKSDQIVRELPGSLQDALCAFLVSNAIRDLRGEGLTHRSMLVNVSQFTRVQDQVEDLVHTELKRYQTSVRSFSALPASQALGDDRMRRLHDVYAREYSGAGVDWNRVQAALHDAVLPVTSRAVNQRTGPTALDYRVHRDSGLRVVAVGGNSLSRGLTLEGLVISYFRRTTQMYDTLLQMGRWFGYRPGYEDLCRVWLPQNTIDWFGHISEATDELRDELRAMNRLNKTPKDFGLAVRAHPDSLLVTARNKMRSAKDFTRVISLSTQGFESVELPGLAKELKRNFDSVSELIRRLAATAGTAIAQGEVVPAGLERGAVAALLRDFTVPATDFRFQPSQIADLLDALKGSALAEWDVIVPTGNGRVVPIGGVELRTQIRAIRYENPPGVLVVSGSKRRVGSRGVEAAGLSPEEVARANSSARESAEEAARAAGEPIPSRINVADRFYRQYRRRPLLLLHVLDGKPERDQVASDLLSDPLVAVGLSFPRLDNEPEAKEVRYKINLVRARELFGSSLEMGDDVETDLEAV